MIAEKVDEHGGRIFGTAGDSVIAEFASSVQSVRCAVAIQRALGLRNGDLPQPRRMEFRIGINLGDVMVEDDDLLGDGVNVAARLQEIAAPTGICISGAVREQVEGKVDSPLAPLGERALKNIPRPVTVYGVDWSADERSADAGHSDIPVTVDRPAVAVLPFAKMSGDTEQEYFADGITEDIITALTLWRSFPVIARNSTFIYKNRSVDIKPAGRELGARYLLEGSVRKGGQRVRITAQLIDGDSGHHLWAERYDRELDGIFELQDEIAQRIAAIVAPELTRAEVKRSSAKRAEDLDAWDYCQRGAALIRERAAEGNAQAREYFERAVAVRPDYADGHVGLAATYNQDILLGGGEDRATAANRAIEAARTAIGLDDTSPRAHQELATAYQWLDRQDDALAEARIAVDLNPNDAFGLHGLGNKSDLAGDPDGISYMEKAQKLNPQDAQFHTHLTFLARAYLNTGAFEDAADRARKTIRRQPDYPHAHFVLALALGQLGRADEARAALATCDALHPGFVASRRDWRPYADATSNERLQAALRRLEIGDVRA